MIDKLQIINELNEANKASTVAQHVDQVFKIFKKYMIEYGALFNVNMEDTESLDHENYVKLCYKNKLLSRDNKNALLSLYKAINISNHERPNNYSIINAIQESIKLTTTDEKSCMNQKQFNYSKHPIYEWITIITTLLSEMALKSFMKDQKKKVLPILKAKSKVKLIGYDC